MVRKPEIRGFELLQRMEAAVNRVQQRLLRANRALRASGIPYAVVGGHAVAAWVATVDVEAVRNTQDVDLLVDRRAFGAVRVALEGEGFVYRHAAGMDLFLDGPQASPRSAVHLVFAGERVKEGEPLSNPGIDRVVDMGELKLISLEDLVRIKLTAFRDKDRTHLRDLIGVGLVDAKWVSRMRAVHVVLGDRLEGLLAHPDG